MMCRKLFFLISIVLVLGLANSAAAANYIWNNDMGDADWCNEDNWDPDGEGGPGSSDTAIINWSSPERGPIIGIGCNVDVDVIQGPEPNFGMTQVMDVNTDGTVLTGDGDNGWMWRREDGPAGTGIININGSPWITIDGMWRGSDDGISIVNIDDDPCIILDGDFRGADGSGELYVNMSGGYFEISGELLIGDNGGGEINMSGGTMNIMEDLNMGGLRGSAPVAINMTGGLIRVGDAFRLPGCVSRAGNAWLSLNAGVIDCNEFVHGGTDEGAGGYTDDWRVDIEQGILIIGSNVKNDIDANVAAGQITAYNGDGTVVVERVDGNTVVTALAPDPNMARNGYPLRGSVNVDVNEVLHWTPGENATSHNVYIGTDFNDVNQATYTSHPNVDLNTVDVNYSDPCGADPLQWTKTYYWRVDANNNGEIWKGNIWWFTTESPIDDPNLRVWYNLNETDGFVAHDSSGRNYHGALDGAEDLWDPNDGLDGCRIFDEDGDEETVIDVPPDVTSTIDRGITISVWLKDAYNDDDNWVFQTGAGGEGAPYHLGAMVGAEYKDAYFRAGNDSCDVLVWNLDGRDARDIGEWHHWAFVKDENADTMSIYFDGEEVASNTYTQDTLVNIQNKQFKIGAATWSDNYAYAGKIDDFRVYDHPLTLKQIQSLFRRGDLALAWKPDPFDGEKDVAYDVVCTWHAGDYAISHDVFFGTNYDDINDVNSSNYAGYPNVEYSHQDACSYDPCGLLDLDQMYYWRVDEVNGPNTWRGNIWRFRVANFITIDDFDDDTAQDPPSNDWLKIASAGISLRSTPPVIGKHSMRYAYDNWFDMGPGYYSEIESISLEPNDWTGFELTLLSLWFYGNSANAATITEQMYVFLKDNDGNEFQVKYGDADWEDMTDVQIEDWQEWNIPLSHFSTNDVNLANLDNLCIGFGIRGNTTNPGMSSMGVVYFDNIRLYPSRCIPSLRTPPAADLNNDCEVDYEDVKIMADEWLEVDVNFGQVPAPSEANLVGWWKLDDAAGSIVTDYAGYDNNGVIETIDVNAWWVAGYDGNALEFDGGRVRVPDTVALKSMQQVSVCAWIYYSEEQDNGRILAKGADNKESYEIEVSGDDTLVFQVRDGNDYDSADDSYENYSAESNEVENPLDRHEWIHVAGTYDGNSVRCYINGELMDKNDDPNNEIPFLSQDTNDLAIGSMCDDTRAPFEGTIDDVRVYNYALSLQEIRHIATGGTGMFTVQSAANMYNLENLGDRSVNLRDWTEFAKGWLEKKFWPE